MLRHPSLSSIVPALVVAFGVVTSSQTAPPPLPPATPATLPSCGTMLDQGVRGLRPRAVTSLPDGEPLSFEQDPPLLFPDVSGTITLRRFMVVGDVSRLEFHRWSPDNPDDEIEIWPRITTSTIAGRLISIFEPSWDASVLDTILRARAGYDRPWVYWGWITVAGAKRSVSLRLAFNGIPRSDVVVLDPRAQYASNVINIVMPGFGDSRVTQGSHGFDLATATQQALRYVTDIYDGVVFIPTATPVADYGAFHENVRSAVGGINITPFDLSPAFGGSRSLQGVELYTSALGVQYEDSNHEIAHQWGSNFDWSRIAGIARAGHQPGAHSPLWTGGESLVGAVLWPNRRVRATATGFAVEATPAPVHYHPLELYAMGVLPADQVPDFGVFENQAQFEAGSASIPDVDLILSGGVRAVSIRDVIREHGVRSGPTPTLWRRATVLVSTDRLVSQREMDYWNFFAQRLADRTNAGTPTYEGYVPFHVATREAVHLETAIEPIAGPALPETLATDAPLFAATDWRGVEFTESVSTRFAAGTRRRLSGRVTARDAVDFDQVGLIFYRAGSADPVTFYGTVSRAGDFSVDVSFTSAQRGRYTMGVYLYWPNAGAQYARTTLSTIVVE